MKQSGMSLKMIGRFQTSLMKLGTQQMNQILEDTAREL